MERDTLLGLLQNYAFEKMKNNGLLLLPMPTGSGKSYTVYKFIYDILVNNRKRKDKIIFVTSLKKNIDEEDLKKHFKSSEENTIYDNKVLFLKPFAECVIDKMLSITFNNSIITQTSEYKSLYDAIVIYHKYQRSLFDTDDKTERSATQKLMNDTSDNIRENLEPNFRKRIRNLLYKEFQKGQIKKYREKLDYIKNNHWSWLIELYPQVLSSNKQVFLMSMDKFLLRNDPIIEKGYYIFKDLAKDAIVFIDEFDSTKDVVLKKLIKESEKMQIDYITAYKSIYNNLQLREFPAEMTMASKAQQNTKYGEKYLNDILLKCKERSEDVFKKFDMEFNFKLSNEGQNDISKKFLFKDIHSMTIFQSDSDKQYLTYNRDSIMNQNIISLSKEDIRNKKDFRYMISEVRAFLKFFCGCVHILSINLHNLKNEQGEEDYSMEDAVRSILDQFLQGEDNKIRNYFLDEILLYRKNKATRDENALDGSFYERGFSYYSIEDDDEHYFRSSIRMTELPSTPEKILIDICSNSRVFGISATATYNTVIGNYALDYVIEKLKDKYFKLESGEREILVNHFKKSIELYEGNVAIHPIRIENEEYSIKSLTTLLGDEEFASIVESRISKSLDSNISEKRLNQIRTRYVRVIKVFKHFVENNRIYSLLCLMSKLPDKKELNVEVLELVFNKIGESNNLNYINNIVIIDSKEYSSSKENLLKRLSKGEKIMVLSTYQTLGAGQNLQYNIPANVDVVTINKFGSRGQKDFDSIYLDFPTNLYTRVVSEEKYDMIKYISQLEYLRSIGEIKKSECRERIKKAFRRVFYFGADEFMPNRNYWDFRMYVRLKIVQAVGRICRTNQKNKDIYIYYDENIVSQIESFDDELLNVEFRQLLDDINKNKTQIADGVERYVNEALNKSDEALKTIKEFVNSGRNGWSIDAMSNWQKIRHFVMQHPTLSQEAFERCDNLFQPLYIKLPQKGNKYWYNRIGDFKDLDISFSEHNGYSTVSDTSARLDLFLQIDSIRHMFEREENNFATTFEDNDYIISPPVFTNIYLGALGEYVGKEIFKNILSIDLEELTDNQFFEFFDFKVPNSDVYVDFKNWKEHSNYLPNDEDVKPHIIEKLNLINGVKVLIVNILTDEEYKIIDDSRIVEIHSLWNSQTREFNKIAMDKIYSIISQNENTNK